MHSRSSSTPKTSHHSATGAWLSHPGRRRRANEDACLAGDVLSKTSSDKATALTIAGPPWIVAVSDGIGGHHAGAEASQEVVEALAACSPITPGGVSELLAKVSRKLCDRGRRDPECAGMGATIAGLASGARGLFAFNVGDSRVYKFSRQKLTQVTRDDSEAEELIRAGLIDRDAVRPGYLHALTAAIGGRMEEVKVRTHIYPLSVATHARFLICSDGVTDMLPQTVLQEVLDEEAEPRAAVERIFHLAMEAGGNDNITLAVVDVVNG